MCKSISFLPEFSQCTSFLPYSPPSSKCEVYIPLLSDHDFFQQLSSMSHRSFEIILGQCQSLLCCHTHKCHPLDQLRAPIKNPCSFLSPAQVTPERQLLIRKSHSSTASCSLIPSATFPSKTTYVLLLTAFQKPPFNGKYPLALSH